MIFTDNHIQYFNTYVNISHQIYHCYINLNYYYQQAIKIVEYTKNFR